MEKKYLPEQIQGKRITIMKQDMKNASIMYDYVNEDRERLSRFLPWPKHIRSVDDERDFIEKCQEAWIEHKAAQYAIFDSHSNTYMGNVGAFNFDWINESCEIGYWILGQFEGNGYMSEAVRLLDKALFETGFHRVIIRCDPRNDRSRNIPVSLGYHFEGTLRDCNKEDGRFVSLEIHSKLNGV